jgi:DDE_Tnp_1-associated/Transposase DDE domain
VSACQSSPIAVLARCSTAVPDLATAAPVDPVAEDLLAALGAVTDPRKSRGVRHRLLTVLAAAVCAVLAGARSYAVIAEWAHDLPVSVRLRLGMGRRAPSESTFRRILQRIDADELDTAVSGWLARHTATATASATGTGPIRPGPTSAGSVRAIAVDGKTARGARGDDGRAMHLLGALDHRSGIVLGQTEVDQKTNEITAFIPLLARIDQAWPLTGAVITADALHTQREHVADLHARGAHWVLTVKGNQCATRRSVTFPPQVGQTRREVCWVRWLTWIRKVKGTRACQETDDRAQVPGTGCRGTRAVWRKLDCLNPNLQRQQFTATGTAPETGARRDRGVLVRPGHPSRRERCSARAFKEMSGAPGPRFTCDRDERGITVPVRLAVTECS